MSHSLEECYDLEAERSRNPGRYIPDWRNMSDEEFFRHAREMNEREKDHQDTIDDAIAATRSI